MGAWTIAQVVVFGIGLLCALAGNKLSIPILSWGGISLFGVAAFLIGLEAAVTGRFVLGRYRYNEAYIGLPAYAQGVQFMILGGFFVGTSFLGYFDTGRDMFLYLVRRPYSVLITFGVYCLMQAVIAISGYQEEKRGSRWVVIMNVLVSRLLPGIILIVVGLGATGLGCIDLVAPAFFDKMGGGFLEMLYGVR